MNEQIQKAIDIAVEKRLKESSRAYQLPLEAQYKVLAWHGTANGTSLTRAFDLNSLLGKVFVLKSFKIINYFPSNGIDFWFFDGVTNTVETVNAGLRIQRLFDTFTSQASIIFKLNDIPIGIFDNAGVSGQGDYPADLSIDNVYYKFPAKIANIDIRIWSDVVINLQTAADAAPFVKVIVECYLI